jgi:hypothetical protein
MRINRKTSVRPLRANADFIEMDLHSHVARFIAQRDLRCTVFAPQPLATIGILQTLRALARASAVRA